MELGVDMILFGHTHIPIDIEEDGIKIMNPGSPSFQGDYLGNLLV